MGNAVLQYIATVALY